MKENNKIFEKLAIGIFVEGQHLHLACLSEKEKRVRLVDAKILKLNRNLENLPVKEEVISEILPEISGGNAPIDLTEEILDTPWTLEAAESEDDENAELIYQLLQSYPNRKNKIAISMSEPQIYYSYYDSDWGLSGKKLKEKIIEHLVREKQEGEVIQPDAVQVVNLRDGRLMAVVRDHEVRLLNLITHLRTRRRLRPPLLCKIESAETALVNLVNANYSFGETEISVIVYLGHEFSRLIFMQGHEIYNISYIIGAGLDSENINHTIFSRIFLEQDNLNLPQIQNIILTGEAFEVGLKEFLSQKLSDQIEIDYIRLSHLEVIGNEPLVCPFAVAIGSAWSILNRKESNKYDINLLPQKIRDEQKRFKLGIVGWMLLVLLPLVAFFSTVKIGQYHREISRLKIKKGFQQEELAYLQSIEMRLNTRKRRLQNYRNAFAIVDSMSAGANTWSNFLYKLSRETRRIGQTWITEMLPQSQSGVLLKGYAVYRSRIPQLSRAMGGGALKRVEVKQIRNRTVYFFEMEANLRTDKK